MSWAMIDDNACSHPKVAEAGPIAFALWVAGLCWANKRMGKDGFIPDRILPVLFPMSNPTRHAKKLEQVGLWERSEGGWLIHDYHDVNETKEAVEAKKLEKSAARSEAGRIGGLKSGEARRQANEANASSKTEAKPKQTIEAKTNPSPLLSEIRDKEEAGEANEAKQANEASEQSDHPPQRATSLYPANFEDACKLPLAERAQGLLEHPDLASYVQPQRWPEVALAFDAFRDSTKRTGLRLGQYPADKGLVALITAFAAGYSEGDLIGAIRGAVASQWWREKQAKGQTLGLSSISLEVIGRMSAPPVTPVPIEPVQAYPPGLEDWEAPL